MEIIVHYLDDTVEEYETYGYTCNDSTMFLELLTGEEIIINTINTKKLVINA